MPKTCKYDANATPPQFTDHEGLTIESGSHVRVKIAGIRNEVGEIRAIGSINEDYLGYDNGLFHLASNCLLMKSTDLYKTKFPRNERLEKILWMRSKVTELGQKLKPKFVAFLIAQTCSQMSWAAAMHSGSIRSGL